MFKFGKTNIEKYYIRKNKIERMIHGIKKYAWFPIKIETGEYIWLTTYYKYYRGMIRTFAYQKSDDSKKISTDLEIDSKIFNFLTKDEKNINIIIFYLDSYKKINYSEYLELRIMNE
jgi:hypothetical protein